MKWAEALSGSSEPFQDLHPASKTGKFAPERDLWRPNYPIRILLTINSRLERAIRADHHLTLSDPRSEQSKYNNRKWRTQKSFPLSRSACAGGIKAALWD